MTTIIGIDPHPGHHAAAALDAQGEVRAVQEFSKSAEGLEKAVTWLKDIGSVRLAVEGPTQAFFATWLSRLLAEDIRVVPIPAHQVRERRGHRKTDLYDAVLIARVLQSEPSRPVLNSPTWLRPLQEFTRTRRHLARQL